MKNLKKVALVLVTLIALVGCDLFSPAVTSKITNGNVNTYGKILNAITKDYVSVTAASDVSIKFLYGVTSSITATVTKSDDSLMWNADLQEDVDYIVQVKVAGYVDFEAEYALGSTSAGSTYEVVDRKDIMLLPSSNVSTDRTYTIVDTNKATIITTGSFTAYISTAITDYTFTNPYSNKTISGTITDGAFTIPAADQIGGATYTIRIYGVSGYEVDESTTFVAGSQVTPNETITLSPATGTKEIIAVTSVNYLNADGSLKEGLTAITITFNRAVELHPALVADVVDLVGLTTTNDDGDANTISWNGASATSATYTSGNTIDNYAQNSGSYVVSARSSITLSTDFKTVTITMTGTINDDTDDSYYYTFYTSLLEVREKGTLDDFAKPATVPASVKQAMRTKQLGSGV
jgi:hypothetical protein